MSAEFKGVLRPHTYRFKLGEFEIVNISDGCLQMPGPHPIFGADQDAETVAAYLARHHLPAGIMENGFTCTLVNTGKELVLIDVGFGGMMREKGAGLLRQRLAEAGYQPGDIDIVALTHGHPDHIAGLSEDGKPAYPNAGYVFPEAEVEFWKKNENVPEQRAENRELFMKAAAPYADQGRLIKDGDEIATGIRALATHGHSAGHTSFVVESGGNTLLVWGDIANHYIVSLQQPGWRVGFDDFKEDAIATRKRVLDMVSTDGHWVAGFHMPFPSIGLVEKTSDSYRWVPASYQLNL